MRIDSPQIVGNLSVAEGSEAVLTGSFTGSFTGDGSGLTGVAPIAGTGIDVTGTTVSVDATVATVTYVDGEISGLIDSAPGALDTLNELAAALGDDANFASTVTTALGEKLVKASNLSDVADAATAATNLGLGTLDSVQFNAIGVGTAPSGAVGSILATNDIVAFASSDERLKENVTLIEGALDKVEAIRGVEYDWIAGNEEIHINHGHDLGVIAQEVEAVLPVLVQTRDNGYKAVKYDRLTAVLIEAVKELSARVKELESK
jgi:hypothetical protein